MIVVLSVLPDIPNIIGFDVGIVQLVVQLARLLVRPVIGCSIIVSSPWQQIKELFVILDGNQNGVRSLPDNLHFHGEYLWCAFGRDKVVDCPPFHDIWIRSTEHLRSRFLEKKFHWTSYSMFLHD